MMKAFIIHIKEKKLMKHIEEKKYRALIGKKWASDRLSDH
jgi:hypothetical protein